jgi:polyisoprenoid-binding protein YceI
MDTGISARDRKMREMFEAKRFPRITASFDPVDPSALRSGAASAMRFRLSIHGVERSVAPAISGWSEVPGKSARFRATFKLSLRDFGMKPPVAMGFMRVDETVRVEVAVELTALEGAPRAAAN